MAKSQTPQSNKPFSFLDLDKELSKIEGFELGSLLANNSFSEVDEWIPTGNYLLNGQLSGTLFGGIPNTRSLGLMGDPGCITGDQKIRVYRMRTQGSDRNVLIEENING